MMCFSANRKSAWNATNFHTPSSVFNIAKVLRAELSDKQRRTLMHDRYLLLRRGVDLSEKDRLIVEAWLGNFPRLAQAYAQKEAFFCVYEAASLDEAWDRYFAWQNQITPEIFDAFLPLMLATNAGAMPSSTISPIATPLATLKA